MISTRFPIDGRCCRSLFMIAISLASLISLEGCGKTAPPPPGAEEKTEQPAVDLGNDSGAPASDSESPADKEGDK